MLCCAATSHWLSSPFYRVCFVDILCVVNFSVLLYCSFLYLYKATLPWTLHSHHFRTLFRTRSAHRIYIINQRSHHSYSRSLPPPAPARTPQTRGSAGLGWSVWGEGVKS